MNGLEKGIFPIQVLVPYWEIPQSKLSSVLLQLKEAQVDTLLTFVPWQHFETDLQHGFVKFLILSQNMGFKVLFVATPEPGVQLPSGGIPREIALDSTQDALDVYGNPIRVLIPPNSYAFPSFLSPVVENRYYRFLSRLNSTLLDLQKSQKLDASKVTLLVTSSFFKYYRSNRCTAPFSSPLGDRSKNASLAFRSAVESRYATREFVQTERARVPFWKYRENDHLNRLWFLKHQEETFRKKTEEVVLREGISIPCQQIEFFVPEADPSVYLGRLLQASAQGAVSLKNLSGLIFPFSQRKSFLRGQQLTSWIYWSSLGAFRALTDPEKQFLILKTLLKLAPLDSWNHSDENARQQGGGGIVIDYDEWLSLSVSFRAKACFIAEQMRDFKEPIRAAIVSPNVWSDQGQRALEVVKELFKGQACMAQVQEVDFKINPQELIWLDSKMCLTTSLLMPLLEWVMKRSSEQPTDEGVPRSNRQSKRRILIIPDTHVMTDDAERLWSDWSSRGECRSLKCGDYQIRESKRGAARVWRLPLGIEESLEAQHELRSLISHALGLTQSGAAHWANVSDPRLEIISLEDKSNAEKRVAFVLNPNLKSVTGEVVFDQATLAGDLTRDWSQNPERGVLGNRFALEVPPCGVLPIGLASALPVVKRKRREFVSATQELLPFSDGGVF